MLGCFPGVGDSLSADRRAASNCFFLAKVCLARSLALMLDSGVVVRKVIGEDNAVGGVSAAALEVDSMGVELRLSARAVVIFGRGDIERGKARGRR
jgi:hypothetical protein